MVSVVRNYLCCSNAFPIAINVFNKKLGSYFAIQYKDFHISRFCCVLF